MHNIYAILKYVHKINPMHCGRGSFCGVLTPLMVFNIIHELPLGRCNVINYVH